MTMRLKQIIFFAGLLLALAGCSTIDSRIGEKQEVFDRLDPRVQAKIREGIVQVGYTQDMVYIALGQPDARHEKVTAKGDETTWIYKTYYEQFEGVEHVGYHRIVYFDPAGNVYHVYREPVSMPVYSEREEENIRVTFVNGKVTAIEQNK
jgi:outer membrane protein assembly factor BamE (lipoprotein component of BamABCDE complex)